MAEKCRPVDVDGVTVQVHGSEVMTDEDRGYFAEVVRAATARAHAERGDR